MGLLLLLAFFGCTAAASGTGGATSNTLQTVLKRGHVIVGTGSNNVPWHFKNEQGEYEGFDVEMARILADALFKDPSKVEFVEQASDARIPNVLTNKVDVTFQFMTISPERAQQVAFSVPYYVEGSGLIGSVNGKWKSHAEMKAALAAGQTITFAILQNAFADETVQHHLVGAKSEQFEEQAMVLQAVQSGRVDAGVVDTSNLMWEMNKRPDLYISLTDPVIGFAYPQNYGAAMRPDDQIWINFVDAILIDCMTGATFEKYNAAYTKWFGGGDLPGPQVGKPKMYQN
jgi:polar amino acid transport system substrate-binding protein